MDDAAARVALRRARGGDEDAFTSLYGAFAPRVLGLCRQMLGHGEDAEDAASETFLRVCRGMDGYDPDRPFSPWLLGVASHLCIDRLRRRGLEARTFEASIEDDPPGEGISPLYAAIGEEERERLREAVRSLPERYRLPVVLRYVNGWSYDRIAEALGIRPATVGTLLFRGRRRLREALGHGKETGS